MWVQPNTRLRRNATRPRRAPLRSPVSQRCFGLRAEDGPIQMRYVTRDNAMPRGCKPERERALSNAERQARYRARQHDQMPTPKIRYRWPADRRSRAQRWCDAVNELVTLQPEYVAWLVCCVQYGVSITEMACNDRDGRTDVLETSTTRRRGDRIGCQTRRVESCS